MKYKTRFYADSPDIRYISKNSLNLMIARNIYFNRTYIIKYTGNNTIGFVKIFESKVSAQ
jgi:hypothetical protein